jgi:hypothetical protein
MRRCERVKKISSERAEFGPDHDDRGLLFCCEDGRPPHPDTITHRLGKLVGEAGLPKIRLQDVRRSNVTVGRQAKINWNAPANGSVIRTWHS